MHPTLWVPLLGPVSAAPAMVIVGAAMSLVVGVRVGAWLEGIDARTLWLPAFAATLCALVGGRVHFVLNNPQFFAHDWWSALRPAGAMHIPGVLLGGLVGLAATVRFREGAVRPRARCDGARDRARPGAGANRMLSAGLLLRNRVPPPLVPVVSAAQHLVYKVHEAEGWIPPGAQGSLPVHPTQLYFLAVVVLGFVAAFVVRRRTGIEGHAAWTGLVALGIGSAAVEPLRAGQAAPLVFWLGRSQLWWSALALAGLGTAGFVVSSLRRRNVSRRLT